MQMRLYDARGKLRAQREVDIESLLPARKVLVLPAATLALTRGEYRLEAWKLLPSGERVRFEDRPLFRIRVN